MAPSRPVAAWPWCWLGVSSAPAGFPGSRGRAGLLLQVLPASGHPGWGAQGWWPLPVPAHAKGRS